jgi:4'-phosphopantetheinyl transferase EntD
MMETLLPTSAVAVEALVDDPDATLFPEEEQQVGKAVEKRRREFTTARVCARRALAVLGFAPAPILAGPKREPLWPAGVVGSITHCAGYRAAAVARRAEIPTIGIDAEPHGSLPRGVLDQIALPDERASLAVLLTRHPEIHWDRLLFSAKESVYKAWFPLAGRWLGFEDAAITLDPAAGTFAVRLLVAGPDLPAGRLVGFDGRWLVANGLVLTAVAEPVTAP